MTRTEFVKEVAKRLGISKRLSSDYLETFENVIMDEIADGGYVKLTGFGTFETVDRKARPAQNIHTGETIMIPDRKVVKFKVGKYLKDCVEE